MSKYPLEYILIYADNFFFEQISVSGVTVDTSGLFYFRNVTSNVVLGYITSHANDWIEKSVTFSYFTAATSYKC